MIAVAGKPVLERQIETLSCQGIKDFTLAVGHMSDVIRDYFADGSRLGVHIDYLVEDEPLGTGGALGWLAGTPDPLLVVNGDILFDVDIARFEQFHRQHGGLSTVFTHPNDHPYDSALLQTNNKHQVTQWITKESPRGWFQNRVNAGLHILEPELVQGLVPAKKDLDRDVLKPLIGSGKLFAYDSPEYVKDMGTPDRLTAVEEDLAAGVLEARSLRNKQKALFLDRDGTLNRSAGFLSSIDNLVLIDGMAEYVAAANRAGYLVIVITNQPVIARGELSWEGLQLIHAKLETLLGDRGAYLNDIFVCPHHPDAGFPGERAEYKCVCECRKPKPGLLFQAAERYNIDLAASFMVGDHNRDKMAAQSAGCGFIWATQAVTTGFRPPRKQT
jgi:D-glycero-D-manno-heptose 1,7-bisphosphate phosphatase